MSTENTVQSTQNTTETAANQAAPASTKAASPATKKVARKPVKKVTAKAPRKVAAQKPASPAKKANSVKAKPAPEQKAKKPKLVRDSFTFPKDEYQAIAGLKQKALGLNHSAKKSEILRAGLMLLNGLNDKAFLSALAKVPALKTGRPAKS
jgi:FtsZ-interacting cell division protein ZipA